MIRGTTPTYTIGIPFDTSVIKTAKLIYKQGDKTVLCKTTDELTIGKGVVEATLSQEETFLFKCGETIKIKLRVLCDGGEALATQTEYDYVEDCYDDEVLK